MLEADIRKSFTGISVPERYTTRTPKPEVARPQEAADIEGLRNVRDILLSDQLHNAIDSGSVTLGIIKPRLAQSPSLPRGEDEALSHLLGEIGEEHVLFSFSVSLSRAEAEEFYLPNKERFQQIPRGESNIWESVIDFTSSGPATFVLLYDKDQKAVEWWRGKMGASFPSKAEAGTIRAQYATDDMLPNNIVHGSDQKSEVHREVGILAKIIDNRIQDGR